MEVTTLCLLLLLKSLHCRSAQVSLTVTPQRSQFFKYDTFTVSCKEEDQKGEEASGWTVMKRMQDGEVEKCPFPCSISTAFPATDSGVYWCESGLEATSNMANITVTAGPVILESPVLPVVEGDNVTLCCRCKVSPAACELPANFYKDGLLIGTSSMGNMIIHNVSKHSEGLYKCNIRGYGDSPQSWLTIRVPHATSHDPPPSLLPAFTLLCHLMVVTPYLLSTILLGLIYRDRARAQQASEPRQTAGDLIMQIVT